ncbi:MAG TPA: insulinase family protein [Allosphingosinicella sp.]|nr:insulinase family protein [Allosphingosinicella sp.]
MTSRLPLLALAACLALAPSAASSQPGRAAPASAAPAWPQQGSDLLPDPDVRYGSLPNGMRYALRRNATPPGNASLRLRIDAGSLHEAEDQRGLAHFIEHMVMNGTRNVPEGEFVRRLERHGLRFGPDTNASTEFTQTVYKLDLPNTTAATVDEALFLLREAVGEALLAPAAIDAERGIIQSEERTRSTPQLRVLMDQLGFLLPGQILPNRFPIGLSQVIAQAQRDRFAAFYDAWYRPERATLFVVGDFDLDAMEAKIRARFADWRGRGPAPRNPDLGTVRPQSGAVRLFVEPGTQTQLSLTWARAPDLRPDSRAVRADRLANLLALQVLNRRLGRLAAGEQPPFVISQAALSTLADSADLLQLIAILPPGDWRRGLAAVDAEARRLGQFGVSQAELDTEIAQIRSALNAQAAGAATRPSAALAEAMVASLDQDNVFTPPALNAALFEGVAGSMTPARIGAAARALFAGEPLLYLSAPAAIEGGEAALRTAYAEAHRAPVAAPQAQQAQAWPYTSFGAPGQVAERRALPAAIGATAVRFANGVRLTVKQTGFSDDQILVSVRAGNGRRDFPAGRPGPEWALGLAFPMGGLGRISAEDLQQALAGRQASAAFAVGDDAYQLVGATQPRDLALQLQLLAASVTDAGWRPTGWDRLKSLAGPIQDQLAATPEGVLNRDSGALLHNGDPRWATPTREQMAASNIAEARAIVAPSLTQGPIEVTIVGDVEVEEAIRLTAATFGALPARAAGAAAPLQARFPAPTPEPVRLTHNGRADQGLAYIAWPTQDYFANIRQARVLTLLSDVFELRLIQKIREEQGTTYSPVSGHDASDAIPGYGLFSAQIQARPEALAGFLRDAQGIAADLAARPIEADELQRALRPRLESLNRQRNGNAWWLGALARIQIVPAVAGSIESVVADYSAITPAELQAAARRFLGADRAWKLVVAPREGAAAPAQ